MVERKGNVGQEGESEEKCNCASQKFIKGKCESITNTLSRMRH